jgi:hypothetical protein
MESYKKRDAAGTIASLSPSLARGEILRSVEVAEELRRESGGLQFIFIDGADFGGGKERVDFETPGAQGFAGEIRERAAVDCAERLPPVGSEGDDGVRDRGRFGLRSEELEQRRRNEGKVDGEDQIQIRVRGMEGGVDSGEWSATAEDVGHGGSERRESRRISDDADVGSDGAGGGENALEQGASVEGDEGLVGAHACALSAGKDEGGEWMVRGHFVDHTL